MKNNKGFVLTETLVVTVFLITIFTFIYASIVPLLGRYEDVITREKDIDIIYKLYHIRKMIFNDNNHANITTSPYNEITCDPNMFNDATYCSKLMEYLELTDWTLVYVDNIYNNLEDIKTNFGEEMYDYIKQYQTDQYSALILLDNERHTIAHLAYHNG